jgi:hypothetical protein
MTVCFSSIEMLSEACLLEDSLEATKRRLPLLTCQPRKQVKAWLAEPRN